MLVREGIKIFRLKKVGILEEFKHFKQWKKYYTELSIGTFPFRENFKVKGSERKHAFESPAALPKYVDRWVGDILDEADQGHVSLGLEDLLLAAHDAGGGLVDLQPGDDAGGGVVGGLAEIVPTVRELGGADL